MAMQKRKQESEKRKRLKADAGANHATAPVESRELVPRESAYGGGRSRQVVVNIADTSQGTNTSSSGNTLASSSRRSGFYLIINITDMQLNRTEVSGHVPEEQEQSVHGGEEGSTVPLSSLIESLFGSIFLIRRQENTQEDTNGQEDDRNVQYDIRDIIVGIFSALSGSSKTFKRTVKRRDLEKIPTVRCCSDEKNVCSICLSVFARDDELRLLRCKHMFHSNCVDPWLLHSSDTCPMCRESVLL
eukprot:jgi/Antlo1/1961/133